MAFLPQCSIAKLPPGLARYLHGSQAPPIIKKLIEAKWNTDNRHKRRLLSVVRKFKLCQSSFYQTASIWWKQQAPPFPLQCRGIQPSFTPQESCSNSSMVAGTTLVCNAITHDICCFSATISNQPPSPVCRKGFGGVFFCTCRLSFLSPRQIVMDS